ncbi:S-adenosyl-L-methionine-dependent methyltransferase [Tirmania nivea]|nr:S-adenosyl-L-methionine-dependent methyltransferase [Tirmania nivea]
MEQITDPDRLRLVQTFNRPVEEQSTQWNLLWADNFMPWDKGFPSPALADLLSSATTGSEPVGSTGAAAAAIQSAVKKAQKYAVVPGCGKGYDVKLLAEHGFTSFGVEIAERAVKVARECYNENKLAGEGEDRKGRVEFILGDYFKDDWVKREVVGEERQAEGAVDLIYDYTFLCALHPTLRPQWAKQMTNLLAKGTGLLICLEFPLYKSLELPGPPWGLRSHIYDELLSENFELVERYKPEKTYKIGEGTDMLSVWRRKGVTAFM